RSIAAHPLSPSNRLSTPTFAGFRSRHDDEPRRHLAARGDEPHEVHARPRLRTVAHATVPADILRPRGTRAIGERGDAAPEQVVDRKFRSTGLGERERDRGAVTRGTRRDTRPL